MKFTAAILSLPAAAMAVDVVAPGYNDIHRELMGGGGGVQGGCFADGEGVDKMAICHGTASDTNPYVLNCVDNDSTCDADDGCEHCDPGTLIEDCCLASLGPSFRRLMGGGGGPPDNGMCGGHGKPSHNSENEARYDDYILAFDAAGLVDTEVSIPCPPAWVDAGYTGCYLDNKCDVQGDCIGDCDDPSVNGDPHIKSFTGEWFEYMGACDLVLAQAEKFDGHQDIHIHARTTIRYDYSYIESLAIQIGKDVLEVDSFGNYALNDVTGAEQTYGGKVPKLGGYMVYKTLLNRQQSKHKFDIVIDEHQNITVTNMKDIVSFTIHHKDNHSWQNVAGLMGHANGKMLARDGATDMHDDIDKLADEWQVQPSDPQLFRTLRAPQFPQKCVLPDKEAKEARRLGEGISEEAAAEACKRFTGATFHACVYDVTATNDLDMADSGAY